MGIGRHDRVAVVLPNGPELAVAILAVAASAACAPMNPAYRGRGTGQIFRRSATSCIDHAGWNRLAGAPRGALARHPCHRAVDRARCGGRSFHAHGRPRGARVRRAGQPQRRGAAAAHVRHDVAAEDRPADARQYLCVGFTRVRGTGAERNRSVLECACPCFTGMVSSPRCWPRWRRARASYAPPDVTSTASSRG